MLAWWAVRLLTRRISGDEIRRGVAPWDCGFGGLNAHMQYTSASFSQPLRRIFAPVWEVREEIPQNGAETLKYRPVRYKLEIAERSWRGVYAPIAAWVESAARQVTRLQTGNLRVYIAYPFFTLLLGVAGG